MNTSKKQKRVTWGDNIIITSPSPPYTYPKATETNQQAQMEITLGRYEPLMIEKDMEENEEPYTYINNNRTTMGKRTRIRKKQKPHHSSHQYKWSKRKNEESRILTGSIKIQVALITETKLREKQKINIKGYKWIGKNRKQKDGGGDEEY